jgi:hypothetical protein
MKISIIGTGNVGGTLGKIWAEKGHTIIYGVRNPSTPKIQAVLQETGPSAKAEFIKDAVQNSDVAVLATPWEAVGEVVFQIIDLKGKILIDCTNPIQPNPEWPLSQGHSAAEEIAKRLPGFKVVKAFNTIGTGNFSDLTFELPHADTFMCGDDAEAKTIVAQLAKDMGFDAIDVGGLRSAEMLESLAKLWITLAHQQGIDSSIAFKLLHK